MSLETTSGEARPSNQTSSGFLWFNNVLFYKVIPVSTFCWLPRAMIHVLINLTAIAMIRSERGALETFL